MANGRKPRSTPLLARPPHYGISVIDVPPPNIKLYVAEPPVPDDTPHTTPPPCSTPSPAATSDDRRCPAITQSPPSCDPSPGDVSPFPDASAAKLRRTSAFDARETSFVVPTRAAMERRNTVAVPTERPRPTGGRNQAVAGLHLGDRSAAACGPADDSNASSCDSVNRSTETIIPNSRWSPRRQSSSTSVAAAAYGPKSSPSFRQQTAVEESSPYRQGQQQRLVVAATLPFTSAEARKKSISFAENGSPTYGRKNSSIFVIDYSGGGADGTTSASESSGDYYDYPTTLTSETLIPRWPTRPAEPTAAAATHVSDPSRPIGPAAGLTGRSAGPTSAAARQVAGPAAGHGEPIGPSSSCRVRQLPREQTHSGGHAIATTRPDVTRRPANFDDDDDADDDDEYPTTSVSGRTALAKSKIYRQSTTPTSPNSSMKRSFRATSVTVTPLGPSQTATAERLKMERRSRGDAATVASNQNARSYPHARQDGERRQIAAERSGKFGPMSLQAASPDLAITDSSATVYDNVHYFHV